MEISKRNRLRIVGTLVIVVCLCLAISTTDDRDIDSGSNDTTTANNTTIDEKPTPTPTPMQKANLTAEDIVSIAGIAGYQPTEEPIQEVNCTTTIGGVVINKTVEPVEIGEEYDMAVDGGTVVITDEDIHNATMSCDIGNMTFEEFKRHVRDGITDGQAYNHSGVT